jgi:hypothetical protein
MSTLFAALLLLFVQLPFKFNAKPVDSAPGSVKATVPDSLSDFGTDSTGCNTTGPLGFFGLLVGSEDKFFVNNFWIKNITKEYRLQQMLLKGFQQFQDEFGSPVNRYNIRQAGFTSDLNFIPPCIPVQYNFDSTIYTSQQMPIAEYTRAVPN